MIREVIQKLLKKKDEEKEIIIIKQDETIDKEYLKLKVLGVLKSISIDHRRFEYCILKNELKAYIDGKKLYVESVNINYDHYEFELTRPCLWNELGERIILSIQEDGTILEWEIDNTYDIRRML